MSYLVLKTDTHTVAKQEKEGDALPFGKVTFGDESVVIDTYGGYGDLSRQRIERMSVGDVSFEMRCLTAATPGRPRPPHARHCTVQSQESPTRRN